MSNLFEAIYVGAILVCGFFASRNDERPYRVPMCLVGSGPNGEDMDSNVWSDMIDQYRERYPGSHCGTCAKERACPKE